MTRIIVFSLLMLSVLLVGCAQQAVEKYAPTIDPSDFSTDISNKYFSMPEGKKMVYESQTDEGIERTEVIIPGWTKTVMGVKTLVFWDRVFLDDELVEDTRDYIAQDKDGNVWYFGEDVDNYEDGQIADHGGSWTGGVDGALPGIWMKADPIVGDEYRQEYYEDEAEDMARVDAVGASVSVPAGEFDDCVKIFEWTPLERSGAYKYHCSGAGATVLEEEGDERVALISLSVEERIELPASYASQGVVDRE